MDLRQLGFLVGVIDAGSVSRAAQALHIAQPALSQQIEHARAAAEAAAGAEQRILNSYQAGLSAYTNVVTAQATSLSARRSVLQLQVPRQQAAVALVQAMGGGWQAPWGVAAS